jgi:hypothetical protein
LSFLLCLCLLFNKIRDKGRTGSAWNDGVGGKKEGAPRRGGPQQGEMAQTMYAHVYKQMKKIKAIKKIFCQDYQA